MAFENIKDIKTIKILDDSYFFLDANVWIYAMNSTLELHSSDKGNPLYIKLFFDLVESTLKPRPRIILCGLLMSEIINTYLRKIAMIDYLNATFKNKGKTNPPNFDYKIDYRPTEHFKTNYKLILNEIKSYHESIHLIDDGFASIKPFQFGKNCPPDMDFNDYYYYLLACKLNKEMKKFAFVTNDKDFNVSDFEIYTSSIALLSLKSK